MIIINYYWGCLIFSFLANQNTELYQMNFVWNSLACVADVWKGRAKGGFGRESNMNGV